jgi:hypothetical protein
MEHANIATATKPGIPKTAVRIPASTIFHPGKVRGPHITEYNAVPKIVIVSQLYHIVSNGDMTLTRPDDDLTKTPFSVKLHNSESYTAIFSIFNTLHLFRNSIEHIVTSA